MFAGSEQSLASYTRRGSTTRACRDAPRDAPSSLPPPAPTSDSSSLFHPKTSSSRYMKSSSSIGAPALDPGDPALGPGAAPDAATDGGRRGGTTTVRLCAWLWLESGSSVFNKIGLVLGPVETLGGCWRAAGEPIPNVLKYFRRHESPRSFPLADGSDMEAPKGEPKLGLVGPGVVAAVMGFCAV